MPGIEFAPPGPEVQPFQITPPQSSDPLETLARLQAIKGQQLSQQSTQQEMQQRQMQIDQTRQINAAYMGALTTDASGKSTIDTAKLSNALATHGAGAAIPTVMKGITDFQKSTADLAETNGKVAVQQQDYAGTIGATLKASDYDPHLFVTMATHAVQSKAVDPQHVAPLITAIQNSLTQDPSGAGAKQLTQQIADGFIQASPKQRELMASETQAGARQTIATTGQAKEARESAQQSFGNNISALAAAPPASAQEYADRVGKLPPEQSQRIFSAVPPGQYDPQKSVQTLRMLGMTPDEQAKAAKPTTLSADEQALNAAAALYAKKNNITLDPSKPWQSQLPAEAAPAVFAAAKGLNASPDVAATHQLANEMTQARLDQLREQKAGVQGYVEMMKQNPDVFHELTPQEKGPVALAWQQATGLPIPVKLSAELQKTDELGQVALQHVTNIRSILQDPAIQQRIGPILGRLGQAEMGVGATTGLTPEQAQKAQDLRGSMTYLFMREGKALFGGRPPQQLMSMLEKTSPRVSETAPLIQGSLDAVERSARSGILTAEKQRFGGQTRPGFTPGFPNAPINAAGQGRGGAGQAGGGGVPPMPATLSSADVGKTYLSKTGQKMKITAVNPQNPKQFQSEVQP